MRELFEREGLGEPSGAVQEVWKKIRKQTPTPARPAAWPGLLNTNVPFVGRTTQLQQAQLAYQRGWTVAVLGEAGSGKTRLVYELFQALRPAPRLLLAPTHPMERSLPFQPLVDMLRHSILDDEWRALESVWASQLARLLPELSILRPDVQIAPEVSTSEGLSLLFEALRQILLIAARSQKILLVLEDAQWSDEATLQGLAYLANQQFFANHGLLVLNIRPEERSPHLEDFLTLLNGRARVQQITLGQLDREEARTLTAFVLGQEPSSELVERLARESGGNPLFLLESLLAILELSPNLCLAETLDRLPMTGSIYALVSRRLQRLNAPARKALTLAAVVGRNFTPDVLEEAARMDAEEMTQALEELEQANLIRPVQRGEGEYEFIHDKIRETLLLDLSQARRRMLHLRVAQALETRSGKKLHLSSVLARHFEAAGELETACDYWIKAGQHAHHLFSKMEAYDAYQRAERIMQRLGFDLPEENVFHLYDAWARVAFDLHDVEALQRIYHTQMRAGEQRRSALLTGSALSGLGYTLHLGGSPEQGRPLIEQALFYLDSCENRAVKMAAHNRLGIVLTAQNRLEEGARAFEQSLRLGASDPSGAGILDALARAEVERSKIDNLRGQPECALQRAQSALENSRRSFSIFGIMRAQVQLSWALFYLGRYTEALEHCPSVLGTAGAAYDWRLTGSLHLAAARSHLALGQLDEAWRHSCEALELGRNTDSPEIISEAWCIRGDLFRNLGGFAQAEDAYRKALLDDEGNVYHLLLARFRLGSTLLFAGQEQAGMALLNESIAYGLLNHLAVIVIPAEVAMGMHEMEQGRIEQARALYQRLQARLEQLALATLPFSHRLLHARILLAEGDAQGARAEAREVARGAASFQNPWLELHGLALLVKAQDDGVDGERVRALLDRMTAQAKLPELQDSLQRFCNGFRKLVS